MLKGDTKISIPGGETTIDFIVENFSLSADTIIESYDKEREAVVNQPVCLTQGSSNKDYMMIRTEDVELIVTLEQKVYVYDKDEWITASKLTKGMTLLARNDDPCEIIEVLRVRDEGLTRVYSLSVAEQPNFYANGILIHSPNTGDLE